MILSIRVGAKSLSVDNPALDYLRTSSKKRADGSELAREYFCGFRMMLLPLFLLAVSAQAQAQQLGRLFFTPDQRAVLENLKGKPQVTAQISETITVNGVVRRAGGKNTVWINGVPYQTEDRQAGGVIRAGKPASATSVLVIVPGSGKSLELKVGQSVEVSSGAVSESPARARSAPKAGEGEPHASPENKAGQ